MSSNASSQAISPAEAQAIRPVVLGWMLLYAVHTGRSGAVRSLLTAFQQEWNASLGAFRQMMPNPPVPIRSLSLDGAYGRKTATALYLSGLPMFRVDDPNWALPYTWNPELIARAFVAVQMNYSEGSGSFAAETFWDAARVFRLSDDARAGQAVIARLDYRARSSAPVPGEVTSQTTAPGGKTMSEYAGKLADGSPVVGPNTGVVDFTGKGSVEHSFEVLHVEGHPQEKAASWAPWVLGALGLGAVGLIYTRNQ